MNSHRSQISLVLLLVPWVGCHHLARCDQEVCRRVSPDGAFVASAHRLGDCIASVNSVTLAVDLADRRGFVRSSTTVFSAKNVVALRLSWLAPRQLRITASVDGIRLHPIYVQRDAWHDVSIVYEYVSHHELANPLGECMASL